MAKTKTRVWDLAEHLETKEDMGAYLEAALEDGDPALVAAALGDIARAKGMAEIARERCGQGRYLPRNVRIKLQSGCQGEPRGFVIRE